MTRDFFIPKLCKARQWPGELPWIARTRNPLMIARAGIPDVRGTALHIWPRSIIPPKRLEKFVQWCGEVLKDGFLAVQWIEGADALNIPEFLMMRGSSGEPGQRVGTGWEGILQPRTGKIWQIGQHESDPQRPTDEGFCPPLVLLPEFDSAAADYYEEFWKRAYAGNNEIRKKSIRELGVPDETDIEFGSGV